MNESSTTITKRMQIAALLNVANYVAKYPNFPFDSNLCQPLLIDKIDTSLDSGYPNKRREQQNRRIPDNAITFAWNEMFTWSCPCIFSHLGASLSNVGQISHPHAPALFPTPTKYPTFTNLIWRTHEFVAQESFKRQLFHARAASPNPTGMY